MLSLLQERLAELTALCQKNQVQRLQLFGSGARDDFDIDRSDFDFLVEFQPMSPREHADSFFELLSDLESLFGRHVDLIEPQAIENPYLRSAIEKSKQTLYAAA